MAVLRPIFRQRATHVRAVLFRSFHAGNRQLAEEAHVVEVGPRDGLQNEKVTIPLETKLELIRRLASTGVRSMEAGAFVSAKAVPQVPVPFRAHSKSRLNGECRWRTLQRF